MALKLQETQRDLESHQLTGLREHSHTVLKCSGCRRDLLDLVVTKPEADFVASYRAECPYCPPDERGKRERSFPVVLKGSLIIGMSPDGAVEYAGQTIEDGDGDEVAVVTCHTGLKR